MDIKEIDPTLIPREIKDLKEEWEKGIKKINELSPIKLIPPTLSKFMNFSDSTIDILYSTGVRYLQKQNFSKAADIFFFLSLIDFHRHNIWVSLGISEMKLQQFEPALNAFAMASITNSQALYPYLYSAECCIALQRYKESNTYLTLAKEALESLSAEEKDLMLERIQFLQQHSPPKVD